MDNRTINKIASDAKLEISHQIDKFVAYLQNGTSDPENFITITQSGEKLSLLRSNTTKTYSDILSAYLSSMDETELIKRKKENTGKGGILRTHKKMTRSLLTTDGKIPIHGMSSVRPIPKAGKSFSN